MEARGVVDLSLTSDAAEFVRFCHRRRRVGWPELYDEMCQVASRGAFRGWGPSELAEHGIGFSLFVVGLAAFNLLLDFDFIEKGARSGLPKGMEWYAAFGLVTTIVWLYLELLRLLSKLQRR